jgi:hypothetical protein
MRESVFLARDDLAGTQTNDANNQSCSPSAGPGSQTRPKFSCEVRGRTVNEILSGLGLW